MKTHLSHDRDSQKTKIKDYIQNLLSLEASWIAVGQGRGLSTSIKKHPVFFPLSLCAFLQFQSHKCSACSSETKPFVGMKPAKLCSIWATGNDDDDSSEKAAKKNGLNQQTLCEQLGEHCCLLDFGIFLY